jgi:diguanylate cyclase (GGDEF)-like protein/PAS domain S-box-containing protein
MLSERLPISRLTFAQHRATESTVTLYSLDGNPDSCLLGPKIIGLEPSRLQESVCGQREFNTIFGNDCRPDRIEHDYLARPGDMGAIYVPLHWKSRLKGILVLALSVNRTLSTTEHGFVRYLGGHLALALENSDTHYMERRRGRQLEMVSQIARLAVMLEDQGEFLRRSAELLRNGFDYDVVQIWTTESRQDTLILRGLAQKSPHAAGSCTSVPPTVEECLRQKRTLCNNNVASRSRSPERPPATASHMAVPIRLRGKFIGVLWFESSRLDAFPAEDLNTMEGVASLLAAAFDNLRNFERAQQSNEYMQAILESAKDLAIISTDLHGYVITVSIGCEAIFHLPQQQILGRDLLTLFSSTKFQHEVAAFMAGPNTSMLERSRLTQTGSKRHCYLDVVLQRVYGTGNQPIGFLCIVRDVTETVLLHQRLEALSITDELTGLFNQRRFFASLAGEMERSRRFNRTFSLCFFDLDGLKEYNDTRGHVRGDQALRDTAMLIRGLVRASVDTCFRYGGDEFTIMMPETGRAEAQAVTERILGGLNEHFKGEITASVGIAEFSSSLEAEELIEKADVAMYRAKSQGGNRIVLAE